MTDSENSLNAPGVDQLLFDSLQVLTTPNLVARGDLVLRLQTYLRSTDTSELKAAFDQRYPRTEVASEESWKRGPKTTTNSIGNYVADWWTKSGERYVYDRDATAGDILATNEKYFGLNGIYVLDLEFRG